MSLSECEKYAIAQILACGEIDYEEFKSMNSFLGDVQRQTINSLEEEKLLAETLFDKF